MTDIADHVYGTFKIQCDCGMDEERFIEDGYDKYDFAEDLDVLGWTVDEDGCYCPDCSEGRVDDGKQAKPITKNSVQDPETDLPLPE